MAKVILTKEGKEELERRADEIRNVELPIVQAKVKAAREQGDLSENAEYHAAREHQGQLQGELMEIEEKLKNYEIIQIGTSSGKINVGSKVTYIDLSDKEEYTFVIVGTVEANIANGRISNESPVGQALLGHKVGDKVVVRTPRGDSYKVEIIEVI